MKLFQKRNRELLQAEANLEAAKEAFSASCEKLRSMTSEAGFPFREEWAKNKRLGEEVIRLSNAAFYAEFGD